MTLQLWGSFDMALKRNEQNANAGDSRRQCAGSSIGSTTRSPFVEARITMPPE